MVYSSYKKQRILFYHNLGMRASKIKAKLAAENLSATRQGIFMFIKTYTAINSIARRPGSGNTSKIISHIKALADKQMFKNDETTAVQLFTLLNNKGYHLSLRTILRCRTSLGWSFRGTAYCQMIREANKAKRLQWATDNRDESFEDVIWMDESTIQIETHRRFCCRKKTQKPRYKPRYVRPYLFDQGCALIRILRSCNVLWFL